ncbi:MAG: ABC transporter ATP-binding protein [Rhodoferax sp.]
MAFTATSGNNLSNLLRRLWLHIGARRRRQFVLLMGLMLASALAEVVSLGAVLPFLGILTAPEVVLKAPLIEKIALVWGIKSAEELVFPLTVAFAGVALLAGALRILLLWATTRVAYAAGSDLSIELYRRTLYQPYRVHASRNTSTVLSGIGKVGGAMNILSQCLMLISAAVLLLAITAALVAVNPVVASISIAGFGASYGLITWVTRKRLHRNSQLIAAEQTRVFKSIQEGLGGIRDVLLDGTQPVYCDAYRRADLPLRRGQGSNVFIAGSPRFAMEAVGMVLIATLAYALSRQAGGISSALPVLGALALGAQRLLPALQQGFSAWATIIGNQASLADTIELLDQPVHAELLEPAPEPLVFRDAIRFDAVHFHYGDDGPLVLKNFNLLIPKGARVGFVGATGSGKSSALDLLMGLLEPSRGEVLVDGLPITGRRLRAWQRTIAHVPQSIYLADASVAENIALGVPLEQIDLDRVKLAARQAQIADFVESRPEGYFAQVGERGIRLSGGQRQRVGIARALYKQASVLVFDEATSALDNITEQSLMDAIDALNRDLTILIIAHRLTTVRRCDLIVEVREGRIVAQGTFDQLIEMSSSFRRMANEEA